MLIVGAYNKAFPRAIATAAARITQLHKSWIATGMAPPRQKQNKYKVVITKKKKTSIISSMALGCLALAMGLVLAPKAQAAKPVNATATGQSIMVNLQAEGTFAIVQTLTYKYNRDTAATYFDNLWDGNPPAVSPGNIHDNSDIVTVGPSLIPVVESECTPTTVPPGPPAVDATEVNPGHHWVVGENQCNFLNGTALTGATYTQDATASASCHRAHKQALKDFLAPTRPRFA